MTERFRSDFRSDTITQPSPQMRGFMMEAVVGDDVMSEDPTVNELELYAAQLLGKEAAVFTASGTMANQVSVRAYAGSGDEILTVDECHLFYYEAGAAAGLSGVQLHPVPACCGIFDPTDFLNRIRCEDVHFPVTKAIWVENTHNRGGGRIVPFQIMKRLYSAAQERGVPVHVDGARLLNAVVSSGKSAAEWSNLCDSLSICFSKGLGAPVGSIVAGSAAFIQRCRCARKAMGGGMRQAGIVAAGALYALKNNIPRLARDHELAKSLAQGIDGIPGLKVNHPVETNIILIDILPESGLTAENFIHRLAEYGVLLFDTGPNRLRMVTHMDVDAGNVEHALDSFKRILL